MEVNYSLFVQGLNNGAIEELKETHQMRYLFETEIALLLKQTNPKNLFLSLEPLPYEQISRVFTAATIGLAFYENVNDNFSKIAMASGKLVQYLKYGKPVLTTNQESLVKIVDQYKFGLTIKDQSDPLEMKAAIETILENYSFYSQNAKICFESEYDFAKKVKPLLSFMQSLS